MRKATWVNGKKRVSGSWEYHWPSDTFYIYLDSTDRITGQQREIEVKGDAPEWGNWKREAANG